MNSFIETLNQWGGNFSSFAWPVLWQSSLLIAVVFGLDWLLARKLRAAVRYALWLVVLVKLLLPPTLALPTGAAWWLTPVKPVAPPPAIHHYTVTYGETLPPPVWELPSVPLPPPPAPKLKLAGGLLLAAAAVSVALLFWMLVRWWQVTRIVRRAATVENFPSALHEAWRLSGAPGTGPARWFPFLKRAERVLGAPKAGLKIVAGRMSPAVCGLFRPVILLPRELAERLAPAQLRAVLLHELFHLRRGDVWVNCAQALLQILYWWHPLLWLANARIRRLREEAVDDAVMLALREEADGYAPTLLAVAKLAFRRPRLSLGLVGILESRSALRQRIERLVDFHAPRRAGPTLVSLFGIFMFSAVAVPMGGAPAPTPSPAASNPPNTNLLSSPTNVKLPDIFMSLADGYPNHSVQRKTTGMYFQDSAKTNQPPPSASQLTATGKLLFEMGRLNEATTNLEAALALEPDNAVAKYYLGLADRGLAQANSRANNKLSHAGPGRQSIMSKLEYIRLDKVSFDRLPLREVLRQLTEQSKLRDDEHQEIRFFMNETVGATGSDEVKIDPRTGLPLPVAPESTKVGDAGDIPVTVPLLRDLPLQQALEAIVLCAARPVRFQILDDGVRFEAVPLTPALFTRVFALDLQRLPTGLKPSDLTAGSGAGGSGTVPPGIAGRTVSTGMSNFLSGLGVDLKSPPGKAAFYNDRLSRLYVKATETDLDRIERALQTAKPSGPQIHIKARFIEVPASKQIQLESLMTSVNADTHGFQGILNHSNFLAALRELNGDSGVEYLAEPEVTTLGGRQTQMRATQIMNVVTNYPFQTSLTGSNSIVPQTCQTEFGPILDVFAYPLADDYTINLRLMPSFTQFLGYDKPTNSITATNRVGKIIQLPKVLPRFRVQETSANLYVWDGQTVVLGGLPSKVYVGGEAAAASTNVVKKELLIFITATLVDATGERLHSDDEMPFAQKGIPTQPAAGPGK